MVYVSWRLARQTIDTLLDAAPAGIRSRIIEEVYRVDGVLEVDRVRIRRAGSRYFADIAVAHVPQRDLSEVGAGVTRSGEQNSARCCRTRT